MRGLYLGHEWTQNERVSEKVFPSGGLLFSPRGSVALYLSFSDLVCLLALLQTAEP